MPDYPILVPCICTIGHIYEWEAFLPNGIHDDAIGIECPLCRAIIGSNLNWRFKNKDEFNDKE